MENFNNLPTAREEFEDDKPESVFTSFEGFTSIIEA
jgi:hypothetical protein